MIPFAAAQAKPAAGPYRLEQSAFNVDFKNACVIALCSHMGELSLQYYLQRVLERDSGSNLHEEASRWLELHVMDRTFSPVANDLTMIGLAALSARPEFGAAVDEIIDFARTSPWPRVRNGGAL